MKYTWTWSCLDQCGSTPSIEIVALRTAPEDFDRFRTEFDRAIDSVYQISKELTPEEREAELLTL